MDALGEGLFLTTYDVFYNNLVMKY